MSRIATYFFVLLVASGLALAPFGVHAAASLAERLAGRILLQVEDKGKAWYADPFSKTRVYLGRPADAFRVMRELGLGITTKDLERIAQSDESRAGDKKFAKGLAGKILLQVEAHGEAWYVNPVDLKRYFLGRPSDAFAVMRNLGLGVSNANLEQIAAHEKYADTEKTEEFLESYYDVDYGFSVQYPDLWEKISTDRTPREMGAVSLMILKAPTGSVSITFRREFFKPFDEYYKIAQEFESAARSLDETISYMDEEMQQDTMRKTSLERIVHHGDEAYRRESTFVADGLTSKMLEIVLLHNNRIFSIEYTAPSVVYDHDIANVNKTMQSFQFPFPSQLSDKRFEHKQTGVSFLIPSAMKHGEVSDHAARFFSTGFDIGVSYFGGIDPIIERPTLEEHVNLIYPQGNSLYDAVYKSSATLGGIPAIRVSTIASGGDEREVRIIAIKNGQLYSFDFTAPTEETRDRFLPVFEQMVNSFQFVNTAVDDQLGVRFFYPSTWTRSEPTLYEHVLMKNIPHAVKITYSGHYTPLYSSYCECQPKTLNEYADRELKAMLDVEGGSGYQNVVRSWGTLGGMTAVQFTASGLRNQLLIIVATVKDERLYTFLYEADNQETHDRFLTDFKQIISSFQFVQ